MESTNRDLLQSIYEFEWGIEPKDLTEYQYRCKIMDIIEAPPTKWTPKKADMEKYFQYLKMDKQVVTSRLVTFMANVKRAVDKNGIERHLESDLMMKTFIKVVASKITPADLRFRVEENMRTVKVEDVKAFAKILKQQFERGFDAELLERQQHASEKKRGRDDDKPEGLYGRRCFKYAKKDGYDKRGSKDVDRPGSKKWGNRDREQGEPKRQDDLCPPWRRKQSPRRTSWASGSTAGARPRRRRLPMRRMMRRLT
ncbi:hypothetical protein DYB34_012940 [Aphanomyces astaci]|uniref:Uncharacterized protein n=2 Tax=Aphanomyces astaci TaxID=112090 RepID=A0A3R7B040_APHAT|nr:hypothetical protein DYB34_012940 [Aphanomyces astaci]